MFGIVTKYFSDEFNRLSRGSFGYCHRQDKRIIIRCKNEVIHASPIIQTDSISFEITHSNVYILTKFRDFLICNKIKLNNKDNEYDIIYAILMYVHLMFSKLYKG